MGGGGSWRTGHDSVGWLGWLDDDGADWVSKNRGASGLKPCHLRFTAVGRTSGQETGQSQKQTEAQTVQEVVERVHDRKESPDALGIRLHSSQEIVVTLH